jgi:hypothetical protein
MSRFSRRSSLAVAVSLVFAGSAWAQVTYTDAIGDVDGPNVTAGPEVDIASVTVSNTSTSLNFQINMNSAADIGTNYYANYLVGIQVNGGAGGQTIYNSSGYATGDPTVGNPYGAEVGISTGMNYFIGSYLGDPGSYSGGANIYSFSTTGGWTNIDNVGNTEVTTGTPYTAFSMALSDFGFVPGSKFNFDVWTTYSGGQGAYDALDNPNYASGSGVPYPGGSVPETAYDSATAPGSTFASTIYTISAGAPPVSAWNASGGGDYNTAGNWANGVPSGAGAEADFFGAITGNSVVTTNTPVTVGILNFNNANSYTLADAGNGTGSLTLQESGGTVGLIAVQSGAQSISLPVTIASSANVTIAPSASLSISGPVTINSGVTVTDTSGGGKLQLSSLSIASGGTLDLTNNTLLIDFGSAADPAATIRGYLISGYNATGMKWTGTGITSSAAAANPTVFSLGYADGGNPIDVANTGVSAGEVEIKYTVAGDANLSGGVDLSDLVIVASDFGQTGDDWAEGDVNYDGNVDLSDLVIVASNFGASLGSVQSADLSASFQAEWKLALAEVHGADAAVPEPACLAAGAIVGLLISRRRR